MLDTAERKLVMMVFNRFFSNEKERTWTDLDSNLEIFGWLSEKDLIQETRVKTYIHSEGIFRCLQTHDQKACFAPYVLEAANHILSLYEANAYLHPNNRYILEYYLVMSEMGLIFSEPNASSSGGSLE